MSDLHPSRRAGGPALTGVADKFLAPGRQPCRGGSGAWPEPGLWAPKIDRIVPCERGYHVCGPHQLLGWLGPELWRAEWRGESIDPGDKLVVGEARLVGRITAWDERSARLFACDCADRVVRLTGPDERCVDAIAVARRFAAGEATEEELAAARDAARDAAWGGAAWDAARGAAWGAAAWGAARAAAWGAARDASWAAAWGADPWVDGRAAERSWQAERLLEALGLSGGE
jgi:hypothetical protein